jgi:hypothetical protein
MHSAVLGCTMIPAGTNLHELMAGTIREHEAAGWTVENDGSYGFLSCHNAGVRRMVAIVQVDPAQPVAGAYSAPCPPSPPTPSETPTPRRSSIPWRRRSIQPFHGFRRRGTLRGQHMEPRIQLTFP